jgi:hypothetical protein
MGPRSESGVFASLRGFVLRFEGESWGDFFIFCVAGLSGLGYIRCGLTLVNRERWDDV